MEERLQRALRRLPVSPPATVLREGRTTVLRTPEGILRVGSVRAVQAQFEALERLPSLLPRARPLLPRPLWLRDLGEKRAATLETDLGPPCEDPEPILAAWWAALPETGEPESHRGRLRDLLATLSPPAPCRSPSLVRALRDHRRQGDALPFAPSARHVERALDQPVTFRLHRGWAHGALTPSRVLRGGLCHWRHAGPARAQEEDLAPFAAPDPEDPAVTIHVLKYAWNREPLRAAAALEALGVVQAPLPAQVTLEVLQRHPSLSDADLSRILGCPSGPVPAWQAARALGRARGRVFGGVQLRLESRPAIPPRRDGAIWRIRDRDPRRLFSRWHEGIRVDAGARASLTPEAAALDMARSIRGRRVLDGFCGAGGNAVALARTPGVQEVVAVDTDARRLDQARHNAAVYGVEHRIRFVLGDFFQQVEAAGPFDACLLDPPWAAGASMRHRAWETARRWIPRGALKQPPADSFPADALRTAFVFGVGPIVSFGLAWWGRGPESAKPR